MTDGLIVDLVVLAVLIGFAIYGGVKGFAGVILGLASWVIALLLTWRLYPIVANWFVSWGMRDALAVFFEDKLKLDALKGVVNQSVGMMVTTGGVASLKSLLGSEGAIALADFLAESGIPGTAEGLAGLSGSELVAGLGGLAAVATLTGMPLPEFSAEGMNGLETLQSLKNLQGTRFLESMKLPKFLVNWLGEHNTPENYEKYGVDNLGDYTGVYAADVVVKIAAILVTFIVLAVALRLLCLLFEKLNDIPAIGKVNRTLGVIAGIAMGLIVIWLLLFVMSFLGVTTVLQPVSDAIDASKLGSLLFRIDPFMAFLQTVAG